MPRSVILQMCHTANSRMQDVDEEEPVVRVVLSVMQGVHDVCPGMLEYLPMGHSMHSF